MQTLESRCPRCQQSFHCGVDDAQPCGCCGLTLTPELLAALRERYRQCLCLPCLQALAAGAALEPAAS